MTLLPEEIAIIKSMLTDRYDVIKDMIIAGSTSISMGKSELAILIALNRKLQEAR